VNSKKFDSCTALSLPRSSDKKSKRRVQSNDFTSVDLSEEEFKKYQNPFLQEHLAMQEECKEGDDKNSVSSDSYENN